MRVERRGRESESRPERVSGSRTHPDAKAIQLLIETVQRAAAYVEATVGPLPPKQPAAGGETDFAIALFPASPRPWLGECDDGALFPRRQGRAPIEQRKEPHKDVEGTRGRRRIARRLTATEEERKKKSDTLSLLTPRSLPTHRQARMRSPPPFPLPASAA